MNEQEAIKVLRKALTDISETRFGWDGDCGVTSIADDALFATEHFATTVEQITLSPGTGGEHEPEFSIDPDGELCLDWFIGEHRLRSALAEKGAPGEPVAWAVTAERGGIHKLCITRESADRKQARWLEEWPDNAIRVRPLVFGDVAQTAPVSGTPSLKPMYGDEPREEWLAPAGEVVARPDLSKLEKFTLKGQRLQHRIIGEYFLVEDVEALFHQSLEAPEDLTLTQQFWIENRAKIISAIQKEGFTLMSNQHGFFLMKLGKAEALAAAPQEDTK